MELTALDIKPSRLWGFFNTLILVCGFGALLIAVFSTRHFGRFHGGYQPEHS